MLAETVHPLEHSGPRIRVTLSWMDERTLVVQELHPDDSPTSFGRQTHDRVNDLTVGREHFQLRCERPTRWIVEPYTTRNGLKLRRSGDNHETEVEGKALLYDGDKLIAGKTVFTFRIYGGAVGPVVPGTVPLRPSVPLREILTAQQSKVVDALCRESGGQELGVTLAGISNKEIARALQIDVQTVRTHLRDAYGRLAEFGYQDFASYADSQVKRSTLVLLGRDAGYGAGHRVAVRAHMVSRQREVL